MNSPRPKAFLFDIGNVLCTFDFAPMLDTLRRRSERLGADPFARFAETKDLYETGEWSDREFVDHVTGAIGFLGDRAEFEALWNNVFEENTAMTGAVAELAERGFPLYLLSNTNGLHLEYLQANFPVFAHFDGGVFSHRAGSIKPDERIYRVAIETYSLDPASTAYIDDLAPNVATGQRLGLWSHRYSAGDHASFERWLSDAGIDLDRGG